jgi:hypothetical protein
MDLSARVLGTHATTTLRDRAAAPVLTIGRDRFTRHDLAEVECFNYVAALNLSRALADLDVRPTHRPGPGSHAVAVAVPVVTCAHCAVLLRSWRER